MDVIPWHVTLCMGCGARFKLPAPERISDESAVLPGTLFSDTCSRCRPNLDEPPTPLD